MLRSFLGFALVLMAVIVIPMHDDSTFEWEASSHEISSVSFELWLVEPTAFEWEQDIEVTRESTPIEDTSSLSALQLEHHAAAVIALREHDMSWRPRPPLLRV